MFVVPALVLIFLIRLRFPKDSSISDILRNRYGSPVLKLYRAVERADFKIRKFQCDINFLTTCRQHDLFPNFLRFKLYNGALQQSRLYQNCQRQFLKKEIRSKQRTIQQHEEKLKCLTAQLKASVSWLDFHHLTSLIERTNVDSVAYTKSIHCDKLRRLGYVSDDCVPYDKVLFNYSNRVLSTL